MWCLGHWETVSHSHWPIMHELLLSILTEVKRTERGVSRGLGAQPCRGPGAEPPGLDLAAKYWGVLCERSEHVTFCV